MATVRRVRLLGVDVDALSMDEVVGIAERHARERRRLMISVVNVAKLVNLQRDSLLRESVVTGELVLADGMPLVCLSRLKRDPLPERVAGIDLMFELFRLADRGGLRVYLLGAEASTLERVVEIVRRDYPGLIVAGFRDGFFKDADAEAVATSVRDARPDILLVAMSSPKKEVFMRRFGDRMDATICHGVGGSFDVLAGNTRRAPRWMQRTGLEWFYRCLQEPRRMWRRYLVTNSKFVVLALRDILGRHR